MRNNNVLHGVHVCTEVYNYYYYFYYIIVSVLLRGTKKGENKITFECAPFEWSAILPARESIEYLYYLNIIIIGGPLHVQRVCRSPDARFGFD